MSRRRARSQNFFTCRASRQGSLGRRYNGRAHAGWLAALLVLAIAVLLPAAAQAQGRVGDIDVFVQPVPNTVGSVSGSPGGASHGYVEYRVQLKNLSTKDHIVQLAFPEEGRFRSRNSALSTRTVRVAGGQEASVSLFEPPLGEGDGDLSVRVDGVKEPVRLSVSNPRVRRYYGAGTTRSAVLLSRGVPQDFRDRVHAPAEKGELVAKLSAALSGGPGRRGAGAPGPAITPVPITPSTVTGPATADRLALLRSELPVSQWSPNWLGYSCYDAILVTEEEAQQMPAPVQLAVRRYVECGGTLWVHGRKVPDVFSRGGVADGKGGWHVGLGRAVASADRSEPNWDKTYRRLSDAPPEIYHPADKPTNLNGLLVAETTVPVRGLFFLVLVFSVAIGPVNVWLLSKYRKRIWLWWDVPAISGVTCLAVFCYSLFSEGWTPRGKTASLTFLDERFHRATTIGYVSLYCPLTPSRGVHFGVDTDVALLAQENPMRRYSPYGEREGGPWFVDWTVDQHLTSGWVTARVPAYFQFRKNEDRRERLPVQKKPDGSVAVVNALGADIRRLLVADASGRVFEGRDIPAGAERTLTRPAGDWEHRANIQESLRNVFTSQDLLNILANWNTSSDPSPAILPRGGYVAFLTKSPFVEAPLPGADVEDTVAIVCGISKGEDDGR